MLFSIYSGAMRLRTFFRLINTPQAPYGQAAQVIMLVNLHRGSVGSYVPLLTVCTLRKAFHNPPPL